MELHALTQATCSYALLYSPTTQHNWHSAISKLNHMLQTSFSQNHLWDILKDAHRKAFQKLHVPTSSLWGGKGGTLVNVYGTHVNKGPTLL